MRLGCDGHAGRSYDPARHLAGGGEGALARRFDEVVSGPGMGRAKSLTCSQRQVSRAREAVGSGSTTAQHGVSIGWKLGVVRAQGGIFCLFVCF